MATLQTVSGVEFEVDDEDIPRLEGMTFSNRGNYVACYKPSSYWGAKDAEYYYLHKFLLNITDSEVDHIDGNKLNCRKDNLRPVYGSQQNHNRAAWGQYPQGISYDANKELYRARIQINGKRIGLGRFKNLDDAIAARKKYDEEHGIISGGI